MTRNLTLSSVLITTPLVVAAGMALLCSFVFHGSELFNFSINADEEHVIGKPPLVIYALTGRWGLYLATLLVLPEQIFPITSLTICLSAFAVSFGLLVNKFQIRSWQSVIVAAPFFFGFPILLYIFAYNNNSFALGLGILSSTISLYITRKRSLPDLLMGALLIAFGISVYQAVIWFTILIYMADLLFLSRQEEYVQSIWRTIGWYMIVLFSGMAVYLVVWYLFLLWFGAPVVYVDSYLHLDALFVSPLAILTRTFSQISQIYFGSSPVFMGQNLYYRLLMFTFGSIVAWYVFRERRKWIIVLLLSMLLVPFLQYPTALGYMPFRTLVSVPAATAVLALFATDVSPDWIRRWILLPLSLLLIIEFSAINNRQYYAGMWGTERDKLLASEIVLRIRELVPGQKSFRIAVVGMGPHYDDVIVPAVPTSTLGASLFSITGGDAGRIAPFLRFVSDASFVPINPFVSDAKLLPGYQEQCERILVFAAKMPPWPVHGSIAQMGDAFVIKLSEPTPRQIQMACRGRQSQFCTGANHGER